MTGQIIQRVAAIAVLFAFLPVAAMAVVTAEDAKPAPKSRKDMTPKPQAWVAEGQLKALELSHVKHAYVKDVLMEDIVLRQQRLRALGLGVKDIKYSFILIDSPYVNTYENKYGRVRFMHTKHAASLNGDCAACHHYRPKDEKAEEIVACSSCHQEAFMEDDQDRVGLKAAYHLQCMGCHEKMSKGPVDCEGCHTKNPVEHKELVKLSADPTPSEVTGECLRCHEDEGAEMLKTAHWLWRGPSPYTVDHQKSVQSGKGTTTLNNF